MVIYDYLYSENVLYVILYFVKWRLFKCNWYYVYRIINYRLVVWVFFRLFELVWYLIVSVNLKKKNGGNS